MYTRNYSIPVKGIKHAQKIARRVFKEDKKKIESEEIFWWGTLLHKFSSSSPEYHKVFHDEMLDAVSRVSNAISEMYDFGKGISFSGKNSLVLVCKPARENEDMDYGFVKYVTPVKISFSYGSLDGKTLDLEVSSGVLLNRFENEYALSERNGLFGRNLFSSFHFKEGENIGGRELKKPNEFKLRDKVYRMVDRHEIYTKLGERLTKESTF